jgi:hypothetical protein
MPDHSADIALLEALLNAGATQAVVDGQTIQVDPDSIRKRLRELKADDATVTKKRRLFQGVDLSHT